MFMQRIGYYPMRVLEDRESGYDYHLQPMEQILQSYDRKIVADFFALGNRLQKLFYSPFNFKTSLVHLVF
jgi:hypothetical protein